MHSRPLVCYALATAGCLVALLLATSGCSRAGGSTDARANRPAAVRTHAPAELPADILAEVRVLERLRAEADFEAFIEAATAQLPARHVALQLVGCDALLATGRYQEAEAAAIDALRLAGDQLPGYAAQATRLWTTARLRHGLPLVEPKIESLLSLQSPSSPAVGILRHWQRELAGRAPYRSSTGQGSARLATASAAATSLAGELAAVSIAAGGRPLPRVFIDTGGQHTLITAAAAEACGVRIGQATTHISGFDSHEARPGLIESLELGELVLHDVPVLVGDSPALVAAGGDMAIGIDLLHHLRFTIDYPARKVSVELARGSRVPQPDAEKWRIPVWSFADICLAEGRLADGTPARVLVDTGDRAGTFISYHWSRQALPQLAGPSAAMVFRYRKRNLTLNSLELGELRLANWPVVDTIPTELDRLNRVDILIGHDLLAPYKLTIDLSARRLELSPAAASSSQLRGGGDQHANP